MNRTTATAGLAALLLAGGGVALASNGADDRAPTTTPVTSTAAPLVISPATPSASVSGDDTGSRGEVEPGDDHGGDRVGAGDDD